MRTAFEQNYSKDGGVRRARPQVNVQLFRHRKRNTNKLQNEQSRSYEKKRFTPTAWTACEKGCPPAFGSIGGGIPRMCALVGPLTDSPLILQVAVVIRNFARPCFYHFVMVLSLVGLKMLRRDNLGLLEPYNLFPRKQPNNYVWSQEW